MTDLQKVDVPYRQTALWGIALFGGLFLAKHVGGALGLEGVQAKALMLLPLPLFIPLLRSMERAEAAAGFHSPARGRFNRRALGIGAVYIGLILAARFFAEQVPPGNPLLWPVVIAAALPILLFVWLMSVYLKEETDEFLRESFANMALAGTAVLIAVATCWGFLAAFRLAEPFDGTLALPIWAVGAMVTDLWIRKQGR